MSKINGNGSITNPFQNYIAISKYARWKDREGRRETWAESVDRYMSFMLKHLKDDYSYVPDVELSTKIHNAILNLEVMPSMRAIMTAGPAAEREPLSTYNCSFAVADSPRVFDEAMYILMNGTGLGFSVEHQHVNKLPAVADELFKTNTTLVIEDSKTGWAKGLKELVSLLYSGQIPTWDVSKVRLAGARLKTFGGRASGPEPLVEVFEFFVTKFKAAAGRKLTSLEVHDLLCKIAEIVVVGGVRRSALISLSDLGDRDMAKSKSGTFYVNDKQRFLANNSAIYESKPSLGNFMHEWTNLYESHSGERGIFNLDGARKHTDKFGRRDSSQIMGTNPCGEILLRSAGLCNLTEVVVRPEDTLESVREKIELAATLGTWQSSLTKFKYLRKVWQRNAEEERLLGVSLTGVYDNALFNGSKGHDVLAGALTNLRKFAVSTNAVEARSIGINPSVAVTTQKPSGTVSQLVDCASGGHPRFSRYYIRTVRGANMDPLTQFLKDCGVPNEPDFANPTRSTVFSFPIFAGKDTVTRHDVTALEHLEIWKIYKENWTEHNPSVTIQVAETEWFGVADWVYKNFDAVTGIAFLDRDDHVYQQAPYQDITKAQYESLVAKMPELDWSLLSAYESTDEALKGSQELACSAASGCEVIDIPVSEDLLQKG